MRMFVFSDKKRRQRFDKIQAKIETWLGKMEDSVKQPVVIDGTEIGTEIEKQLDQLQVLLIL